MSTFRDLIIWQKSIKLVTEIYSETNKFPKEEQYGLISQIRRASVSIPRLLLKVMEEKEGKIF